MEQAAAQAPGNEELHWLAILMERITSERSSYVQRWVEMRPGTTYAPALAIHDGDYDAATDLLRPFHAAALMHGSIRFESISQGDFVLDRTERALQLVDDRASIHGVRALRLGFAPEPDLDAAEQAMAGASRLDPDDEFYADALEWLREEAGN